MGPPGRFPCLATIFFTDEEKYTNVEDYNRPIYILGIFENKPYLLSNDQ